MFLVICGLDGDAHFLIGRREEGGAGGTVVE